MGTIKNYLKWRGDLTMVERPCFMYAKAGNGPRKQPDENQDLVSENIA